MLYQGTRSEAGWSSSQLSPPITVPNRQPGESSIPSVYLGLSADLSCGVVSSNQPLTEDPVADLIREAGGGNLYRRNPDGTFTLISDRPPEALEFQGTVPLEFELIGMSTDCSKVVFSSLHHYAGLPGAGKERLYEWSEATGLRYAGFIPDGAGGEAAVEVTPGNTLPGTFGNRFHAVSADGSRVFFSAKRLTEAVAGEAGKTGLFARTGGSETIDVSASETLTPDNGAEYQGATPDGSKVYFTANAGIAENGASSEGTDLYQYDFAKPEGERLTDLSVAETGAAEAGAAFGKAYGALVAVADDGSHVYFIARAQLVPGRGNSYAQNKAANTFSLYDYDAADEAPRFVGVVSGSSNELSSVTVVRGAGLASRTSADGRYLLFESSVDVTGYESGGAPEAYLYDADAGPGEEATRCLSCRTDGEPSAVPAGYTLLANGGKGGYQPQSLVVREGRPLAFFSSFDALAPGATEGIWNLYEWSHGQVFFVASEASPPQGNAPTNSERRARFAGASADGTDLYLVSNAPLNWENPESRPQAWDARVGGGFAQPPAPPAPCDAGAEGSCRQGAAAPPAPPGGGASTFNGPGNVKPKPHKKKAHKKKHHRRHHHKKRRGHAKKHKGKGHGKRHAKQHHKRAGHYRRAAK